MQKTIPSALLKYRFAVLRDTSSILPLDNPIAQVNNKGIFDPLNQELG
jgi:hypothetical protein